jgi:hypothetical protein
LNLDEKKFLVYRKQAWLWSLGDTYRIKDRPRYMSAFGGNSAMDTSSPNPLRYSVIGDNNNIEVCDLFFNRLLFYI